MKQIQELEKFFELDLKVKKLIESSRPNMYDADPVIVESDLLRTVETARTAVNQMLSIAEFDVEDEFDKIFEKIKSNIENCNYNIIRLVSVYENDILKMTEGFEDTLEKYIFGYSRPESAYEPLEECKTVNDMLHYVHFYVVNNPNLLESLNIIEEKKVGEYDWEAYRLFGKDTEIARDIFKKLPENETLVDEVSFDGHVLIMIRDRGHALSIDVQEEPNDNCRVSYFIPKICNIDMVNKVKGVNKVDPSKKTKFDSTHGEFVCKKEEIGFELNSFIKSIPTDNDMVYEPYNINRKM